MVARGLGLERVHRLDTGLETFTVTDDPTTGCDVLTASCEA
jgi:protein gp37